MWEKKSISEKVRTLSDMFQGTCVKRRDSWGEKGDVVKYAHS
jgi:hypothetical protein